MPLALAVTDCDARLADRDNVSELERVRVPDTVTDKPVVGDGDREGAREADADPDAFTLGDRENEAATDADTVRLRVADAVVDGGEALAERLSVSEALFVKEGVSEPDTVGLANRDALTVTDNPVVADVVRETAALTVRDALPLPLAAALGEARDRDAVGEALCDARERVCVGDTLADARDALADTDSDAARLAEPEPDADGDSRDCEADREPEGEPGREAESLGVADDEGEALSEGDSLGSARAPSSTTQTSKSKASRLGMAALAAAAPPNAQ